MNVLIIGGTRFIGPHVVSQLMKAGHDVTVYHRGEHESQLPDGVRHVHSPDAGVPIVRFAPKLLTREWDAIIHMMAMGEADTRAFAAAFAGKTARCVVISSGDVYRAYGCLQRVEPGPLEPMPLTEDSRRRSHLYPYRKTAKSAEDWTHDYEKILVEDVALQHPLLHSTVLRLPKVYGAGDGGHLAMLAELAGEHRNWRWTHGYVEDVAHAIVLAATQARACGKIYNVGEADTLSVAERLDGWNISPAAEGPASALAKDFNFAQDLVYDTSRIRRDLGYQELFSRDEAMRRALDEKPAQPG